MLMLLLIILFLYVFLILAFICWCIITAFPLFFGAPFVKSSDARIKKIIKLLDPKTGEKIIDLGSGNGKILFEIVKFGAKAYGIEINPLLVYETKRQIKLKKLSGKVFVKRGNLFHENLSKYDKIVLYGITYLMPRLEKKLDRELRPGTVVVSNFFKFPTWKVVKKEGDILLYIKR